MFVPVFGLGEALDLAVTCRRKDLRSLQRGSVTHCHRSARRYSIRRSTTGHKSWTQEGGNTKSAQNSQRTSLNGFDIATDASKRVKRRAFELLRIDKYDENMADGIQVRGLRGAAEWMDGRGEGALRGGGGGAKAV